jgi:TRAP transporter TAXI family solute receptor
MKVTMVMFQSVSLRKVAPLLLVLSFAALIPPPAIAQGVQSESLNIGSARFRGAYYPAANALCAHVTKSLPKLEIKCGVLATDGSFANLVRVQDGRFQLGIVQSDVLYREVKNPSTADRRVSFEKVRYLFAMHPEQFTVLAHRDSGIEKLADLVGRKLSVGEEGSGTRSTIFDILAQAGLEKNSFEKTIGFSSTTYRDALCEGTVDAVLHVGANPQTAILDPINDCGAYLLPVEGANAQSIIANAPYYEPTTIKAGTYPNTPNDLSTFAVAAVLVASSDLDDDVAYQIVRRVFEQRERFITRHKLAAGYSVPQAATAGNFAPYHAGALRYYREAGIAVGE